MSDPTAAPMSDPVRSRPLNMKLTRPWNQCNLDPIVGFLPGIPSWPPRTTASQSWWSGSWS
jgi:hypothetical protein